jgi:hypothetical protein
MRGQMTHPDTDVLAEFRAGLITGRRGARITAHLAGCEQCTAVDGQLAGVRTLLASVPAPAMPDSVAQRLDTVLAAEVAQREAVQGEAAQRNSAERASSDGTREHPAPRRPGGNRGFRLLTLRVLAPAAAVVVLAAGGYGLSRINLGSSTESAASSSAGGAARAVTPSAAGSARVAGPAQGTVPRVHGITPANFSLVTGHRNLTRANLAQQVRAELLVPDSARTTTTPQSQLRGCVGKLAGGHTLELVESVRYEGRPATLIVARAGAADTAWIAARDCSATNRHVLARTTLLPGISGP